MRHGSLFSGIGGFDLAATWLGWTNVLQVELDPFCTKILARHFPDTARFTDIKDFDGRPYRGRIDVLSGGFPCQPFSTAGKRRGKDDARYLWPEMLRVIREVQPTYVLGENVPGFLPSAHEQVCVDLEGEGYTVGTLLLPALAVGAPHLRDRVWVLAYAAGEDCEPLVQNEAVPRRLQTPRSDGPEALSVWSAPQPQPILCGVPNGVPERLALHALGNAIVPQCAYYLFRGIEAHAQLRGAREVR